MKKFLQMLKHIHCIDVKNLEEKTSHKIIIDLLTVHEIEFISKYSYYIFCDYSEHHTENMWRQTNVVIRGMLR